MVETFIQRFDRLERVDRSLTNAEARRNAVLREIDRRRRMFAETVRQVTHKVEDAEFETVESKAILQNTSSELSHDQHAATQS